MSRVQKTLLSLLLTMALLCSMVTAAGSGSASKVVAAALSQVGYVEGAGEYTKFGVWYGLPHGYWCDMFVSWCANQAGISRNVFPASASCTSHVNAFKKQGRFYKSAARGGTYTPQQGDLLFYYNPKSNPGGTVSGHVGLVLYVEDGYVYTIEGNALTNRLDCVDRFLIEETGLSYLNNEIEYVVVNRLPLNNPRTLGYASPNYADRTPLALDGFVDLGRFADKKDMFTALDAAGILTRTSSHTFSPCHGLTRGEFLTALLKVYGLTASMVSSMAAAEPFADVTADTPCFDAVMTAQKLGILPMSEDHRFRPDIYISGPEAQALISGLLAQLGLPDQTFYFSMGDYSSYGEYTIRADLGAALYALYQSRPETLPALGGNPADSQPEDSTPAQSTVTPTVYEGVIVINHEFQTWDRMQIDDTIYLPLTALQEKFPALNVKDVEDSPIDDSSANDSEIVEVPEASVTLETITLTYKDTTAAVSAFHWDGQLYIPMKESGKLMGQKFNQDITGASLTSPIPSKKR